MPCFRILFQAVLPAILCVAFTTAAWAQENRVAFITSTSGTADMGTWPDAAGLSGIQAGDAVCQARARAGGLA
ncbi:MAG: hypothetical protein EA370_14610, partial [Wenzhouxiangella sp.]